MIDHDLPSPQDASADQPVTQVDQETPPTPQGRAEDDSAANEEDAETEV